MKILIFGAAGMVGRKLLERLARDGKLGKQKITHAILHDVVKPAAPKGCPFPSTVKASDFSKPGTAAKLVAEKPDVIFHLAAIVSGEAEADFDKGYRINLDGTYRLFEAIRAVGEGYHPRVVFTSSIAVFGAPFHEKIEDEFHLTPLTSYGTQKAIGEFLLADYTRKGIFDGVGIRLPTICVRPGAPNK
ncbi:MAG: NAD-dependent epimerase/dehydratase family protein, partial [Beijerinckiaceae bacterium]